MSAALSTDPSAQGIVFFAEEKFSFSVRERYRNNISEVLQFLSRYFILVDVNLRVQEGTGLAGMIPCFCVRRILVTCSGLQIRGFTCVLQTGRTIRGNS